jgi:hypothetical protein
MARQGRAGRSVLPGPAEPTLRSIRATTESSSRITRGSISVQSPKYTANGASSRLTLLHGRNRRAVLGELPVLAPLPPAFAEHSEHDAERKQQHLDDKAPFARCPARSLSRRRLPGPAGSCHEIDKGGPDRWPTRTLCREGLLMMWPCGRHPQ